jgi:hypothetical protein
MFCFPEKPQKKKKKKKSWWLGLEVGDETGKL